MRCEGALQIQRLEGSRPGGLWDLYLDEPVLIVCKFAVAVRALGCRSAASKQQSGTEQSNPGSSIETLLPRLASAKRDRQVSAILAGALLHGQARNFPAGIDTACGLQLQGRVGRNQSVEVGRHPVHDHESVQGCESGVQ